MSHVVAGHDGDALRLGETDGATTGGFGSSVEVTTYVEPDTLGAEDLPGVREMQRLEVLVTVHQHNQIVGVLLEIRPMEIRPLNCFVLDSRLSLKVAHIILPCRMNHP